MAYNKETGMWEGYIYKIVNDVNDIVYIGQTTRTIDKRFIEHKKSVNNETYKYNLVNAFREIGISHFNVVQIVKISFANKNDLCNRLNKLEQYYIKKYKENGIKLYNMSIGGDVVANNTTRPVIQYDLFCNEMNRYNSISEASQITGIIKSSINTCCLKYYKEYRAGNYIWRFLDDPLTNKEKKEYYKRYPGICQYDFDGNLLNIFFTLNEANEYMKSKGYKNLDIGDCCKGKDLSAGGYIWRYRKDDFYKYRLPKINKKIEQRNYETGELIQIFNNSGEASRKTGINASQIRQCCLNNRHSAGGYIWCYNGDPYYTKSMRNGILIDMYDSDNNYIKTYNAIKQAVEDTGISIYSVLKSCKENCIVYNYLFKYHSKTSRKEVVG